MTPHILIVDPDGSASRITGAGVERVVPGGTLAFEPDPQQALASIEQRLPDVMIIDPPRNLLSTARLIQTLKQAAPNAQIIALASAPTPTLRRALLRLGADSYLAKPAPLPALREALRYALQTLKERQLEMLPIEVIT